MPFCPTTVTPFSIAKQSNTETSEDFQFEDFNHVTAFTVVQAIRQLSSLTLQASNVFETTLKNIQDFVKRTSLLEPRLREIELEVSKLNKKRTKVGRSSLKKQNVVNFDWKYNNDVENNIFTPISRPLCVEVFREGHSDSLTRHVNRYQKYLKEYLSHGGSSESIASHTSQTSHGSISGTGRFVKKAKPDRSRSFTSRAPSLRRKQKSEATLERQVSSSSRSPLFTSKKSTFPRPQSCDGLNADSSTENESNHFGTFTKPPVVHNKDSRQLVEYELRNQHLSHDNATSRPSSLLVSSASFANCSSSYSDLMSTPDSNKQSFDSSWTSRSWKKERPVSLFEGKDKDNESAANKLQQNNIHRSEIDSSSNNSEHAAVSSPHGGDNLEVVAEEEEQQQSCEKNRAHVLLNICPSHLNSVLGQDQSEEDSDSIDGSRSALRKSLDLLPSKLDPTRKFLPPSSSTATTSNNDQVQKVARNASFVSRSRKWAAKKLTGQNNDTHSPTSSRKEKNTNDLNSLNLPKFESQNSADTNSDFSYVVSKTPIFSNILPNGKVSSPPQSLPPSLASLDIEIASAASPRKTSKGGRRSIPTDESSVETGLLGVTAYDDSKFRSLPRVDHVKYYANMGAIDTNLKQPNNNNNQLVIDGVEEKTTGAPLSRSVYQNNSILSQNGQRRGSFQTANDENTRQQMAQADDGWPDAFYVNNTQISSSAASSAAPMGISDHGDGETMAGVGVESTSIFNSDIECPSNSGPTSSSGSLNSETITPQGEIDTKESVDEDNSKTSEDDTLGSNSTLVDEEVEVSPTTKSNNIQSDTFGQDVDDTTDNGSSNSNSNNIDNKIQPKQATHVQTQVAFLPLKSSITIHQPRGTSAEQKHQVATYTNVLPVFNNTTAVISSPNTATGLDAEVALVHSDPVMSTSDQMHSNVVWNSQNVSTETPFLANQMSDPTGYGFQTHQIIPHEMFNSRLPFNNWPQSRLQGVPVDPSFNMGAYVNQKPLEEPPVSQFPLTATVGPYNAFTQNNYPHGVPFNLQRKGHTGILPSSNAAGNGLAEAPKSTKKTKKVNWTDMLWKPKSGSRVSTFARPRFSNLKDSADKVSSKNRSSFFKKKSAKNDEECVSSQPQFDDNKSNEVSGTGDLDYLEPIPSLVTVTHRIPPHNVSYAPGGYINADHSHLGTVPVSQSMRPNETNDSLESNYNTESMSSIYAGSSIASSGFDGSTARPYDNYVNSEAALPGSNYYNGFPNSTQNENGNENRLANANSGEGYSSVSLTNEKNSVLVKSEQSRQGSSAKEVNNTEFTKDVNGQVSVADKPHADLITNLSAEEFVKAQLDNSSDDQNSLSASESLSGSEKSNKSIIENKDNESSNVYQNNQPHPQSSKNASDNNVDSKSEAVKKVGNDLLSNSSTQPKPVPVKRNRIHFNEVVHTDEGVCYDDNFADGWGDDDTNINENWKNFIEEALKKKPTRSILRRSASSRNPDVYRFQFGANRNSSFDYDPNRVSLTESMGSSDSSSSNANSIPFIDDEKGSQLSIYEDPHEIFATNGSIDPRLWTALQNSVGQPSRAVFDDDADLDLIDDDEEDENTETETEDEDDENDSVVYHSSSVLKQ